MYNNDYYHIYAYFSIIIIFPFYRFMADLDEFLNFILFGSAVAWICTGIYVAKPNLHGIKFEEATCNITSVETISMWDELPTCSCGKGCSEEYPCVTVRVCKFYVGYQPQIIKKTVLGALFCYEHRAYLH